MIVAALVFTAGCARSDDRLNEAVKLRLSREPTPLVQLDVTTRDRVVTLTGVVATVNERERLERIVRDMDDVAGVQNRLMVQRPVHVTGANDVASAGEDATLKDAIRRSLDEAHVPGVAIEVRDRVVTLRGHLPRDRHAEAIEIAKAAGQGATRIDDALTIR